MIKGDQIIYTVRGQDIAATVLRAHRDGTVTLRAEHEINPDGSMGAALGFVYERVLPAEYRPAITPTAEEETKMNNVVADLIARIEERRTETKNPCKNYSTEAKAESVAERFSKKFATHFAIEKTQKPCRYVVVFDQAWGRWVVGFDLTELMGRKTSTGGYVGLAAQAGFFSY